MLPCFCAFGDMVAVANRSPLWLSVLGFADDTNGVVYLLGNGTGTLNGIKGKVLRIWPVSNRRNDNDN
jgi:hypothetical protein